MYVTNQISSPVKLLHLTVNDNPMEIHITALSLNSNDKSNAISSDKLLHFALVGSNCKTNEIPLNYKYTSIEYFNDKFDKLIAVPLKKKEFEVITILENDQTSFQIATIIQTPHLLKYFQIQVYSTFFVTFGIDGLVTLWDSNTLQILTSFLPHSKLFGGVRKCVVDTCQRCTYNSNQFEKYFNFQHLQVFYYSRQQ